MKLIVMGYRRHGKDASCEYLQEAHGLTFSSSSWTACELFLFDQLKDKYGYKTPLECFEDRGNHRAEWFQAIRAYNDGDLTRLGRHILSEKDIYCGIRNREEFEALKAAKMFDLVVWVDAYERLGFKEDASSMELTPNDADLVIDNNGSLADLYRQLDGLHLTLFERPFEQRPRAAMPKIRAA